MKKIFTLVAGMLLTAAVFAADRKPVVTINNNKNYKIVIDGKSYFGDNLTIRLDDFFKRNHSIKVYEMKRGFFDRKEKLVDATTFQLDRNDVVISIDYFGNIKIREMKDYGRGGRNDRGWDDRDDHNKQDDHRRF